MKVKALLLLAAVALATAGCANDGSGTPGTGMAGRDGCLIGTWNVDVNDMAQQTAAKVGTTAKDGKLAGTMPANTVTSKIVTTVGGKEVPATATPLSGSLDMSSGALGYTCSGSKATLITPMVTWKLTKA